MKVTEPWWAEHIWWCTCKYSGSMEFRGKSYPTHVVLCKRHSVESQDERVDQWK